MFGSILALSLMIVVRFACLLGLHVKLYYLSCSCQNVPSIAYAYRIKLPSVLTQILSNILEFSGCYLLLV